MAVLIFGIIMFSILLPVTWFFEETKVGIKTWDWLETNIFHDNI